MAVLKASLEEARGIAKQFDVEVACDNAPNLVTLSGTEWNIYRLLSFTRLLFSIASCYINFQ